MLSARIKIITLSTILLRIARLITGVDRNGIGICVALCSTRILNINLIAPYTGAWIETQIERNLTLNITNNFVTLIYVGMGVCVALCSAMHILYFALTTHDMFKKRDKERDAKLEQIRDEIIAEIKTSGERSSDLVVGGITQMTQESIMAQAQTAKELNVNLIDAIDRYTQTTVHIIESKEKTRDVNHRKYHHLR